MKNLSLTYLILGTLVLLNGIIVLTLDAVFSDPTTSVDLDFLTPMFVLANITYWIVTCYVPILLHPFLCLVVLSKRLISHQRKKVVALHLLWSLGISLGLWVVAGSVFL